MYQDITSDRSLCYLSKEFIKNIILFLLFILNEMLTMLGFVWLRRNSYSSVLTTDTYVQINEVNSRLGKRLLTQFKNSCSHPRPSVSQVESSLEDLPELWLV